LVNNDLHENQHGDRCISIFISKIVSTLSQSKSNFCESKGLFISPQSIRSEVVGSSTINLSLGLLPVLAPVVAEKAPLLAITPSLFFTASAISSSLLK
jgi:hypothetical protein